MKHYLILLIGFTSQVLFMARMVIQWFKSEHEGKVLSPTLFWKLSLFASILMLIYGILRNDAAILVGQILVYFFYIRNIQLNKDWNSMPFLLRAVILIAPVIILGYLFTSTDYSLATFFKNEDVGFALMVWGIVAQLVFISRFFYQWIYSEARKESKLPVGFWIISVTGASMTLIYGILRFDLVLIFSSGLGMFIYLRNLLIHYNKKSLFSRFNIPAFNKLIAYVAGKIK